jgi:hypothetical protein
MGPLLEGDIIETISYRQQILDHPAFSNKDVYYRIGGK